MPSATFEKLATSKKEAFITAFLEEFASKSYKEASISTVVKQLGIAKGSVYQYFENKMDLFLYLKQYAEQQKGQYIRQVSRADCADFWMYLRLLYEQGIAFDAAHPLETRFLYNLQQQNTPLLQPMIAAWEEQGVVIYTQMIQHEVEQGHFRKDVTPVAMAQFILAVSNGISKRLLNQLKAHEQQPNGGLLNEADKVLLMQMIDEQIVLLRAAFAPDSEKLNT
ncbi:MAG: TetR/AcrR family transcriptional regulator [Aureispira sp.]